MLITNVQSNKAPYEVSNLVAFMELAQLERLIRSRKVSTNTSVRFKVHLHREQYIRTAIHIARGARYNERRLRRLGHELNRHFDKTMAIGRLEKVIEDAMTEESSYDIICELRESFDITNEEKEMMKVAMATEEELEEIL